MFGRNLLGQQRGVRPMPRSKQEMMEIMSEIQARLDRMGYTALSNELDRLEHSPDALDDFRELAKKAEEKLEEEAG